MKFFKYLNEGRNLILRTSDRKKINKELTNLTSPKNKTKYFNSIPLTDIFNILKKYGVIVIQEDGSEWSGFLIGRSSTTHFDVASIDTKNNTIGKSTYTPYTNTMLNLQYHKMQSGKYEIVVYMS